MHSKILFVCNAQLKWSGVKPWGSLKHTPGGFCRKVHLATQMYGLKKKSSVFWWAFVVAEKVKDFSYRNLSGLWKNVFKRQISPLSLWYHPSHQFQNDFRIYLYKNNYKTKMHYTFRCVQYFVIITSFFRKFKTYIQQY